MAVAYPWTGVGAMTAESKRQQAVEAAAQSLADNLGRGRSGYPTKFAKDMVAAAEPFLRQLVVAEIVASIRSYANYVDVMTARILNHRADRIEAEFGGGPDV